ncbi:hypothetical protein [Evansella halocellulosilytica]|uniref:hypothetical protein n=1 Tax=Evansella halocellulosilytica TaxID=2011013 RepID=UPI000BB93E78|nr:hypothetical protein [Evansella halocellulosilytica]
MTIKKSDFSVKDFEGLVDKTYDLEYGYKICFYRDGNWSVLRVNEIDKDEFFSIRLNGVNNSDEDIDALIKSEYSSDEISVMTEEEYGEVYEDMFNSHMRQLMFEWLYDEIPFRLEELGY